MIWNVIHILFATAFVCTLLIVVYLAVIATAGRVKRPRRYLPVAHKQRIAVLIPSYHEDAVIVNTARSAASHNYPRDRFDVFVAADQVMQQTIEALRAIPVNVHHLNFAKGSKARSLNYLLNNIPGSTYDIALILDGDNIMQPGFLEQINAAFAAGYHAVQGHRKAKNLNSPVAVLDAISEEINNFLFRRSLRAAGFSSALIGSGMAFSFSLLKDIYDKPGILDNPACDREVDFELANAGIEIEYLDGACVLDEKVSTKRVFGRQRRRWLESQLIHLGFFVRAKNRPVKRRSDYWNKFIVNLLPPRVFIIALFLFIVVTLAAEKLFQVSITGMPAWPWIVLMATYFSILFIAIPRTLYNSKTIKAILHLPVLLFSYLRAAAGVRTNQKDFVHTPKTYTDK